MPLGEAQEKTSSSDFAKWQVFFTEQLNSPDRTDHYLMQVAAYLAQLCEIVSKLFSGGKLKTIRIGDMLIPFVRAEEEAGEEGAPAEAQDSKPSAPEVAAVQESKSSWAAHLGLPDEFLHGD